MIGVMPPFGQRGSEPIGIERAIREEVICGARVDQLWHARRRSCACPGNRRKSTRVPNVSVSATIFVVMPPRERPVAWL